jgi:sugar phosphate isomerase/epimerase
VGRLSINELTTYRWSFDEDVHNYLEAGIDCIGVWRDKLVDFGEEKGAELIGESGIQVSCLLWAGGFTGSDGRRFSDSIEDALQAIELAGNIGAPTLVIHSGGRGGHTLSHAQRLLGTALAELLPVARVAGVSLALEPMAPSSAIDWTVQTDLREAIEMVRRIDHPALGIVLDTYHWTVLADLNSILPELVSQLALVHLADGRTFPDRDQQRCPLGRGRRPLSHIVSRLEELGYDGWYDVKLMGEEIETSDYHQLLAESANLFGQWSSAETVPEH